jgi:hypothetical protein
LVVKNGWNSFASCSGGNGITMFKFDTTIDPTLPGGVELQVYEPRQSTWSRARGIARGQRVGLLGEVDEMDDVPRLGEVGASPGELLERERVGVLRRLRRSLVADEIEDSHRQSAPSARSRSCQSSSGSSRPTDSRSRPGGTRAPSQRALASMRDVTPPRLVMFAISSVPVSTLTASSRS